MFNPLSFNKILFATAAIVLTSASAIAQQQANWVIVPMDNSPDINRELLLDLNSIHPAEGEALKNFSIIIQPTDAALKNGTYREYSTLIRSQLDCKNKENTMLDATLYSKRFGQGDIVESSLINQMRTDDGSSGDQFINKNVCGN